MLRVGRRVAAQPVIKNPATAGAAQSASYGRVIQARQMPLTRRPRGRVFVGAIPVASAPVAQAVVMVSRTLQPRHGASRSQSARPPFAVLFPPSGGSSIIMFM